jgi:integrase
MAQKRGKRWQGNVRLSDGSRRRPYFDTRREAEAWEANAKLSMERGGEIPDTVAYAATRERTGEPTDAEPYTLIGEIYDYVAENEWAAMKAGPTLMRNGRQVCAFFGRSCPIASIRADNVAAMKRWFLSRGLKPSSVNRRLAALSKMMKAARELGTLSVQPVVKWSREEQSRFRYLDKDEEIRILRYWELEGDTDMLDATIFLLDTGARWSELESARWTSFSSDYAAVTFWTTKSGKPRTVPLTARVREMLRLRRFSAGNRQGPFETLNRWSCWTRWKRMRSVLGFPDVNIHTLRHTCCTRLVLGGVDVKRVMEWMGHSAIVTTLRYMQMRPNGLQEVLHVLE